MRRLAVAVGAVALLAVGGVAFAQTTGDERIYACVNNGDGTMRQVANADVACSRGWHQISWSAENTPPEDIPTTVTYVKQRTVTMAENVVGTTASARCSEPGDVATGGGARLQSSSGLVITDSRPAEIPGSDTGVVVNGNGWSATGTKESGQQPFVGTFFVYVVCQHTE